MPTSIVYLSPATWDALHVEVIEDGDPVSRVDRERQRMLYSFDFGPLIVFGDYGFARRSC